MTLSIIILSYNTRDLLQECLTSIFENLHDLSFEVIVADNDSKDTSVEMVRKFFPKVHLIENKENLGFGKGINQAAKNAKGTYLLFLNSDAKLLDSNVSDMLMFLDTHERVGILGGNFAQKKGSTSATYGHFYTLDKVLLMLFGQERVDENLKEPTKVDWISGGFMMIRTSVFEKLSGFDEHFFMYIEDMELCFRATKLGYEVYYFPHAKAYHLGQGSSNRAFAIQHIFRGLLYFYRKHKSKAAYYLLKLMLMSKAYAAIGVGLVTRNTSLINTYRKAVQFS